MNVVKLISGLVVGSCVNMGILMLSPHVIPPPEGVNVADVESIKASIHLFKPIHFVFPFLAHALGTFFGALLVSKLVPNKRFFYSMMIGIFFLLGGIANTYLIPHPRWFLYLDLIGAYLPMSLIASKILAPNKSKQN